METMRRVCLPCSVSEGTASYMFMCMSLPFRASGISFSFIYAEQAHLRMQVAREVFNRCLTGELREKTRILVTNQLQFVSPADIAIFMANGKIAEIGTYSELMAQGKQFAQLMSQAEVQFSFLHGLHSIPCLRLNVILNNCKIMLLGTPITFQFSVWRYSTSCQIPKVSAASMVHCCTHLVRRRAAELNPAHSHAVGAG